MTSSGLPVSDYLADEMDQRSWGVASLAEAGVMTYLEALSLCRGGEVTPYLAGRLAHAFGTTAELWLNLQARQTAAETCL